MQKYSHGQVPACPPAWPGCEKSAPRPCGQICKRGCFLCRPVPVCSLEPAAQWPQQHRWWDAPGGALCAWLVTKRRKNSWCIHTLGKRTKHCQHRQLCPLAHGHDAQKPVTPAVLPESDVVPGGSGRERVGLGGVWGLCLCRFRCCLHGCFPQRFLVKT